jgi:hypothetical protein
LFARCVSALADHDPNQTDSRTFSSADNSGMRWKSWKTKPTLHLACQRSQQSGGDVQQRGLAGPRRPGNAAHRARCHPQGHDAKCRYKSVTTPERHGYIAHRQRRQGLSLSHIPHR